jgi:hypothetical protein
MYRLLIAAVVAGCANDVNCDAEDEIEKQMARAYVERFGAAFPVEPGSLALARYWVTKSEKTVSPDVGEFMRFVEKRIAMSPPKWWRMQLARHVLLRQVSTENVIAKIGSDKCYRSYWTRRGKWRFSGFSSIREDGGEVLCLHCCDRKVRLSKSDFKDIGNENNKWDARSCSGLAGTMTPSSFIVVFGCSDTDLKEPSFAYCVDSESATIRWSGPVSDGLWRFSGSGAYAGGFCEVSSEDDKVLIATCNDIAVSFDVYGISDGKAIMRFSTAIVERLRP